MCESEPLPDRDLVCTYRLQVLQEKAQLSGRLKPPQSVPVPVSGPMTAQLQIEQREAKTFRLVALADQRTSQRVDALAAKHGVSRANVIRALVLRGLDQEQGA